MMMMIIYSVMMIFIETLWSTAHYNDSYDDTYYDNDRNNHMYAGLLCNLYENMIYW